MKMNAKQRAWIIVLILLAVIVRGGFEIVIRTFRIDYSFTSFLLTSFRYALRFIAVLIWIRIVIKSEYTINKLPWLMFLILEPISGTVMFLTFGRDFRESFRFRARPLLINGQTLTHEPKTDFNDDILGPIDSEITDIYTTGYNMTKHHVYANNSEVIPIADGQVYFDTLLDALSKAETFILIQTYILRTDVLGTKVLNALKEKAKAGVEVYLIYDAIGSVFLKRKMIRSLEQAGVDLQVFDPIQFGFFDTRMTYRNHRKIINIDGRVGFLGGMNIADEYANMKKNYPPFRDTMCQVKGSVLNSMAECFFKDYYYITNTLIKDDKYYSASDVDETGLVQVIPSGPDDKYPPIRNVYVKMINNAKQSIKIITPYLALDNELVTSLIIAAKSGVHVDIIVPGTPDKQLIYYVTESFYDELLSEGIHIHQYDQTFTHAKVLIIDDRLASCGTYNLDNRSARINFEVTLLLYKTGVSLLVEQYNNDLNHSTEINQASWAKKSLFKRIILGLMNLLAPLV